MELHVVWFVLPAQLVCEWVLCRVKLTFSMLCCGLLYTKGKLKAICHTLVDGFIGCYLLSCSVSFQSPGHGVSIAITCTCEYAKFFFFSMKEFLIFSLLPIIVTGVVFSFHQ